MILLHLIVAALYAFAAWGLWPISAAAPASEGGPATGPRSPLRPPPDVVAWLVPVALGFHAWLTYRTVITPDGLDFGLDNAVSLVAGLVALLAWVSGLVRTLPVIGTVVLPVAALASLLPSLTTHPHRFPYAAEPWAAAHVAIALVAYALFIVAAVQALVLMGLEKRLRRRLPDPNANAMPPLLTLERFLFRLITAGFVLLTLTVVSGALFSEELFGRALTFTHKSIFSVLGWLTFGGLLWGRWRYGWRGRIALRWILTGTVFLFLAYLGSKFVLEVLLGR
jgi:ABC-type uncharacterized transport system permease subunit